MYIWNGAILVGLMSGLLSIRSYYNLINVNCNVKWCYFSWAYVWTIVNKKLLQQVIGQ